MISALLQGRLRHLKLAADGQPADELNVLGIVRGSSVLPGAFALDFYRRLSDGLRTGLGLEPGHNFFEFAYDWRLDNRIAASALAERAPGWVHDWRRRSGRDDAQLVIIGHSMGGLIARYAVEVLGLWRHTGFLATLGTPHRGAPKAANILANGLPRLGWAYDLLEAVRSMPSVRQLLPVYPCVKGPGGCSRLQDIPERPGLTAYGTRAGEKFIREIEHAARRNLADEDYVHRALTTYPVVGIHQPTTGLLRLTEHSLIAEHHDRQPDLLRFGDATVPEPSAYPIEWDSAEYRGFYAIPARHSTLAGTDGTIAQLIRLIGITDLGQFRGANSDHSPGITSTVAPGEIALTLELPEVLWPDEPLDIKVQPHPVTPSAQLFIKVLPVDRDGPPVAEQLVQPAHDNAYHITIRPMPAGTYRVSVTIAINTGQPIHELVTVVPAE